MMGNGQDLDDTANFSKNDGIQKTVHSIATDIGFLLDRIPTGRLARQSCRSFKFSEVTCTKPSSLGFEITN